MENNSSMGGFLSSLRVVDLTREKGHYFFGKMLGDMGARVLRVEKPDTERDYWWWSYNAPKTVVTFDLVEDRKKVVQLIEEADILVEDMPPGYLDTIGLGYADLKKINPRLIMTSITPFGQTGPYRDFKASDLELMAFSGVLHGMGNPDRPPVRISFPQSDLLTSSEAAVGAMIALCQRERTGEGQLVDVSGQESVHCMLENRIRRQGVLGNKTRLGGSHPQMNSGKPQSEWKYIHNIHPQIWSCKDGHIAFLLHPYRVTPETNWALVKYMEEEGDLPDLVRKINWDTFDFVDFSPEEVKIIWDTFARFFNRHTHSELYEIALKHRIHLFPGNTVKDLLADKQLAARQYWQEQEIPDLGKRLKFPGPFAKIQLSPIPEKPPRRAPKPGLPFEGVKVLDFTWVVVGPWITQWLAVYGAEVVKIESSKQRGNARHGRGNDIGFIPWNSGKKSVNINLKDPRSQELIRKLVAWADIVIDNFSPGTMPKMGLGYAELTKINPHLVVLSASMLGATGPDASQPGLGQILSSLSGFTELTGWPDRVPVTAHGPYTDVISGRMGAALLCAALDYHLRTGAGCFIDLCQYEASLHFLAPLILEYQANGNLMHRMGNRSFSDSPHGVFPCREEDTWCALSVSSEPEWQAFCRALDRPQWAQDPRFATFEKRKQNEDELETLIGQRTKQFTPEEVMLLLQKAGVKAAVVEGPDELLKDPQLEHRNHLIPIKHVDLGEYDYVDSGFRLEKAKVAVNPAPYFGEHTYDVCTRILGLTKEEVDRRIKEGGLV